jgi:hypothetical protein
MNKTAKGSSGNTTKNAETEISEADNVDKIRDILFGNQMREVNQKFASMEKSLAQGLTAIRKENALQIDSLKTYFESEIEILGSKLSAEEKSRIEDMDELDDRLKQQGKQIDKKISDLAKSLDKNTSDINQKILKQSQDFNAEMGAQISESRQRMDGHRDELDKGKVDKLALSEMFSTLAIQINSDESR